MMKLWMREVVEVTGTVLKKMLWVIWFSQLQCLESGETLNTKADSMVKGIFGDGRCITILTELSF